MGVTNSGVNTTNGATFIGIAFMVMWSLCVIEVNIVCVAIVDD